MNVYEFCKIIDGELVVAGGQNEVNRINIFPTRINNSDTFFAINSKKYSNVDGGFGNTGNEDSIFGLAGTQNTHGNISEIILNGAKTIVYDEDILINQNSGEINYIRVSDTVEALAKYAKYIIINNDIKVIGITGSTGKTTLVGAIYDALLPKYNVSKLSYIRTTFLGLIWHIIDKLSAKCDFLLVEMQTDGEGQIDRYCDIVKLDYAFIVNINYSHIARFGCQDKLLFEKLGVYRGLKETGRLFINVDNEKLCEWNKARSDSRIKTISMFGDANICCKNVERKEESIAFDLFCRETGSLNRINVRDNGKQTILLSLFVSALLMEVGYSDDELKAALTNIKPIVGRFQQFNGINESLVIVDSYNASYDSTIYGIEYLSRLKNRKKILIIGSLLELADNCERIHRKIGEYINTVGNIDYVIALGEATLYVLDEIHLRTTKCYHTFCYEEVVELLEELRIDKDTAVYIKGSGAMRLEIVALYLLSNLRES